jgi:hypothetical protein
LRAERARCVTQGTQAVLGAREAARKRLHSAEGRCLIAAPWFLAPSQVEVQRASHGVLYADETLAGAIFDSQGAIEALIPHALYTLSVLQLRQGYGTTATLLALQMQLFASCQPETYSFYRRWSGSSALLASRLRLTPAIVPWEGPFPSSGNCGEPELHDQSTASRPRGSSTDSKPPNAAWSLLQAVDSCLSWSWSVSPNNSLLDSQLLARKNRHLRLARFPEPRFHTLWPCVLSVRACTGWTSACQIHLPVPTNRMSSSSESIIALRRPTSA